MDRQLRHMGTSAALTSGAGHATGGASLMSETEVVREILSAYDASQFVEAIPE